MIIFLGFILLQVKQNGSIPNEEDNERPTITFVSKDSPINSDLSSSFQLDSILGIEAVTNKNSNSVPAQTEAPEEAANTFEENNESDFGEIKENHAIVLEEPFGGDANPIENGCEGLHTHLENGKCVCDEGYLFGTPSSDSGCWNCTKKCHKDGFCHNQGICKCMSGFAGDGINDCALSVPKALSISPKGGSVVGGTAVYIRYSAAPNTNNERMWCKFGKSIEEALAANESLCICSVPFANHPTSAPVFISFDRKNWSKEKLRYTYYSTERMMDISPKLILAVAAVLLASMGGVMIIYVKKPWEKLGRKEHIPAFRGKSL